MLFILIKEVNIIALEFSFEKYVIVIIGVRYRFEDDMLGEPAYPDPCYVRTYVYCGVIASVSDSLRLLLGY